MEYCPGGELFGLLCRKKKFNEEVCKFYTAQVVLALEHIHSQDIVYRDLKPENVLIDADGYIRVADFGLSKANIKGDKEAFSICGTPEYLAPEVLAIQGHGKLVDWWCLGNFIYELTTGVPPFCDSNRQKLFNKIQNKEPSYPEKFFSS